MGIRIEPLTGHHDRSAFSCGQPELDAWLRRRAGQDEKRNVARVLVAVDDEFGIVGFYALSAYTLSLADLPEAMAKKLPRYDTIPAALVGRLARDVRVRGRGVGKLLLADAIRRILGAGRSVAVFAIVVDAKDERAADFHRGFGFRSFPGRPLRLFLPTSVVATGLERSQQDRLRAGRGGR